MGFRRGGTEMGSIGFRRTATGVRDSPKGHATSAEEIG